MSKVVGNIKKVAIFLLLFIISGCSLASRNAMKMVIPDSTTSDRAITYYDSLPPTEGSLWTDSGEMLFMDRRARRVGDTVIVDIVENTSSKMDANTNTSRASSLSADIPGLTGYKNLYEALANDKLFESSLANKYDGKASSDRSGQITASIGSRVSEVLPNGNIVIYGRRDMKVNNENQTITVFGIIRPEDIGSDNHVKSTYLADAKIEYIGKGVLADKQKPGWGMRVVDKIWPF